MSTTPVPASVLALRFGRLWQVFGWLLVALVTVLTLMPDPPSMPTGLSWDKSHHLIAYGTLMWWFRQAFMPRLLWILFLLGLGAALEFLQGWSGYRSTEYGDMLANALGIGCGLLLSMTPLGRTVAWLDQMLSHNRV